MKELLNDVTRGKIVFFNDVIVCYNYFSVQLVNVQSGV